MPGLRWQSSAWRAICYRHDGGGVRHGCENEDTLVKYV